MLGLVINDVQAIGLDAAKGMYLSEGFYWDQSPATRAFAARFMAAVSKPPNMVQAGLYSGITHYLKAVAAVGDDSTDAVMAKMRAMPVEDAVTHGGTVRADRLMVHDMLLLQVKAPAQSRSAWDLFEIIKTVPGSQAFLSMEDSRCKILTAR